MAFSEAEIRGMTVNERLWALGLLDSFDRAVAEGDVAGLRDMLHRCFVDEPSIDAIVAKMLKPRATETN
mgnify:CR=1 FL=1